VDVLRQWGLGDAVAEVVESGLTNRTWRVAHGGQVWFLRRYRTGDSVAVRREHDLIRHVAEAGAYTPRPVPDRDGETVVTDNEALFALFEAAAGQQLEPHDLHADHAASAGAFLARLHTATADIAADHFRQLTLAWDGAAWADRVRTTAKLIPQNGASELDRWAYQRSMEQAAWLEHPGCPHRYVPEGAPQVIHGDYQHANLFFVGAEVSAVIDWDTAVAICRGFEVVRACAFMFHLEAERTRSFVAGYRSVSAISATELHDGANAWGCFADHHVWPTEERYRHGNHAAQRFIERRPFVPFRHAWTDLGLDSDPG